MTASSELNTVEALAERLAKRAALKSRSPKCAEYLEGLSETDVLTRYGLQKLAAGEGMLSQAKNWLGEQAGNAKDWYQGLDDTARAGVYAGGGALAGGLGAGALNYLATDEDDERRHPFASALTGALAGGAVGGLGTLAYQNWNKLQESDTANRGDQLAVTRRSQAVENSSRDGIWDQLNATTGERTGFTGGSNDENSWRNDANNDLGYDPQTAANLTAGGYYTMRQLQRFPFLQPTANPTSIPGTGGRLTALRPRLDAATDMNTVRSGLDKVRGQDVATRPYQVPNAIIGHLQTGDNLARLQQAVARNEPFILRSGSGTSLRHYDAATARSFLNNLRQAGGPEAAGLLGKVRGITRGAGPAAGIAMLPTVADYIGNAILGSQETGHQQRMDAGWERLMRPQPQNP